MDRYYAIYETAPLGLVVLPSREGDSELYPGENPFSSLAALEQNLSYTEGDATLAPPTLSWVALSDTRINLSHTEGDASVYPGELDFTTDTSTSQNMSSAEGDATLLPGVLDWASSALGVINLGSYEGDALLLPGENPFSSSLADEENLSRTEGDATLLPGENMWSTSASGEVALSQTEGDGTLVPGWQPWSTATGGTANLISTEGDGTLVPGINVWSAGATGDIALSATEGDATTTPGENDWTSQSATEVNLGATEGDGTLIPGENGFTADTAGDINLTAAEGDATTLPGENNWASGSLGEINLSTAEGDGTLVPGENDWASAAAAAINLGSAEGDGTLLPGENSWTSLGASTENLSSTEGDGILWPGENSWTSAAAAAVNISQQEGDGTLVPGENDFATDATDAVNLGSYEGDGELVPGENPFTINTTGPIQRAICFSGTVSTPGYMASDPILGPYNGSATNGYISLWYKYTGTDPEADFQQEHVLFTVWGDTEGDRIEFLLTPGFSESSMADIKIRTSGTVGNNEIVARLSTDITDGAFYHLMFGGDGFAYWFALNGTRQLNVVTEFGVNAGEWFGDLQGNTPHEINAAATRVSGNPNGTLFMQGCIDELMVVNDRNYITHPNDLVYLHNGGNGVRIPEVESDNQDGLWDDTFNGWRFNSDNPGEEYVDGIHNFTTIEGNVGTEGIPGKIAKAAIQIGVNQNRSGLVVDYSDKVIPAHNGNFTIAAWVRLDTTTPTNDMGVATKLYNGVSEWAMWYDAAQERFRGTAWTPTGQSFCYQPVYTITTGTWYMVAIRIEYLSQGLVFSIGAETGGLAHGTPTGVNLTPDGTANILIGMYGYDQQLWDGAIDDVMYWNRYLSNSDLDDLFVLGAGIPYESYPGNLLVNLIMQFNMNECCGTRFDGHGANVGVDGKLYKGQPIPGKEPLAVQGHIT